MKNVKRKLALASIMLCGSVALGLGSLNDAPVSASADTLDGFEVKSASLRVPDDTYGAGIRFTIGLGKVNLAEDATTGVLLIPTSSLGSNNLTLGFSHADLRIYDNVQWKNFADGTKEAYLHLYDVPPVQYTSNISICAYIDNDANPATDPIYSNVVTASVAQVADWAYYNDTTLNADEKATLQDTYLTYKVVYHNEDDVTETTGIYNQKLTAIESPEKVGYTFGGWWNQAGTHQWNFAETTVSSTVTNLYAKWNPATDTAYTVKVFKTTDGGKTQTEISASVTDFLVNRTGTTGADLDITAEANAVVAKLGKGYTLNAEKSVLTGVISADGMAELKIVVNFDEVVAARVGEDENTLLFFDRALGAKQVMAATGNMYAYTTEKAYGNENGSLKVTFPNSSAHNTVNFDMQNYSFDENDYIEFYVYNDTSVATLSLLFGYSDGVHLISGQWTRVVGKASWITGAGLNYFRFYGQAAGFTSGNNVAGSVYISKVKVFDGLDLTVATGDWNIGETTFTGAATQYGKTTVGTLQETTLYKVGDVVSMNIWKHDYAGFEAKLKTPVDVSTANQYVSITVKGADKNLFTIVAFNESGAAFTGATKATRVTDAGNGFVTYTFAVPQASGRKLGAFRITPLGNTSSTGTGSAIIVSNVSISNTLRTGVDVNTLLFFDGAYGAQQVTAATGNTYAYTTEKAYGNENGSLKVTFPNSSAHNTVNFDMQNYSFDENDYIEFYVYNDTSVATLSLLFGYSDGVHLISGQWTRVVGKASWITGAGLNYFRFYGQAAGFTSGNNVAGSVYISKVKVFDGLDLTVATGDWNIGETTFTGVAKQYGKTTVGTLQETTLYKVGDVVSMNIWKHAYAGFYAKLKTAVDVSQKTKYIAITMKGADADMFTILPLGAGGEYDALTSALKPIQTIAGEDGYATYVFEVPATADKSISGLRITPLGNTSSTGTGSAIVVRNFVISDTI